MPCVTLDIIAAGQGAVGTGEMSHPLEESGQNELQEGEIQDFPGGPVVNTVCRH